MDALISVLVPVYNVQKYLHKCLDSIINQTYKNLEIILVDDGSTDSSGAICDEYAQKDSRIKVIHKKNGGLVSARKAAIEICMGEYVGFVDSDDWIKHEMFGYLLEKMICYDVDIVECGFIGCYNGYEAITTCVKGGLLKKEASGALCTYTNMFLYDEDNVNHISPSLWNKLFKVRLVKEYYKNIPEINFGEDSAFVYRCISDVNSMYVSKRSFYCYNKSNANAITAQDNAERKIIDITKMYMFLKEGFLLNEQRDNLMNQLDKYYLNLIFLCLPNSIYEKINKYSYPGTINTKEKTIIYGAGIVGKCYIRQFKTELKLVGILDKTKYDETIDNFKVQSPEKILNMIYDKVLIAVLNEDLAEKIKCELINKYKVDGSKIIWKKPQSVLQKLFL